MTSRPSIRSGMVSAWMANGCVMPEALSASTMAAGTPSSANDVGRGTRPPYWPARWVSLTPSVVVAAGSVFGGVSVETHGGTVHAVALTGGRRAVGEPVTEVGAAVGADGLFTDHAVAGVGADLDDVRADGFEERRPA